MGAERPSVSNIIANKILIAASLIVDILSSRKTYGDFSAHSACIQSFWPKKKKKMLLVNSVGLILNSLIS